jgi:hypothetical protein
MKRFLLICVAIAVLLVPALVPASSCDSTASEYYVEFTYNGETYRGSLGFSDVDSGDAFATLITDNGTSTIIFGTDGNYTTAISDPPTDCIWVLCGLDGSGVGEYTTFEVFYIGIYTDAYQAVTGTITITSFGDVGGAVEGTFSLGVAPWTPSGGEYVPLAALEDIDGSFRLKRVADDTPLPF